MKKFFYGTFILSTFFFSFIRVNALPILNSYPSASATIFLDFDGHYTGVTVWNGGIPLDCKPSGMSDIQILEVFNRVAEDFRPFEINITTDSTVYNNAPQIRRIRIVITTTSSWFQGVGGVAYPGSFLWGDDTPAFVFCDRLGPNNPKMVAETCTHESGHTLGLVHQSRYDSNCNLSEVYHTGAGTGSVGWAPIMGNSFYRNMTGWNNGPTQYDCIEQQDNLTIITTQNGFGYREDDYADSISSNVVSLNTQNFNINGLITTSHDKDVFKIVLSNRNLLTVKASPYSFNNTDNGANLDIKLKLYNSSSQLVRTYDPAEIMNVSFDTLLNAGTYYVMIEGTGNKNTTDYGSLGSYTITGNVATVLPIHAVTLSGKVVNNKHNLNWNIISDEGIKSITVETSTDGYNFKDLAIYNSTIAETIYIPNGNGDCFYRIKVVSVNSQIVYSNTILLKSTSLQNTLFTIPTLVKNEILIKATEEYQYYISDISGRKMLEGKGGAGTNVISMSNLSNGIYIVTLVSRNEKYIARIVKQ
jgi:hypothetical protein